MRREITGKKNEGQGDWTPLPKGTYDVVIDQLEFGVSKNKQSPQMVLKGRVQGGAHDGENVTIFYSQEPKALWKTQDLLDAIEVDYDLTENGQVELDGKMVDQVTIVFDDEDLIGRTCRYDVTQREYNGRLQNDFNKERSPNEGAQAQQGQSQGRTQQQGQQQGKQQGQQQGQQPPPPNQPQNAPARTRRSTGAR